MIGQALSVDLTREEVLQILTDGFLPITAPDEMPARGRSTGLRELGLPYASDPAITKHLAAFLTQAAVAMNSSSADAANGSARRRALQWRLLRAGGDSRADCRGNRRVVRARPRKAAGGPSSSTTKRSRVRWLVVLPTMAACGAAPVCASGSGNARTYYIGLPSDDGSAGHLCSACRGRRGHYTSAAQSRILGAGEPPGVVHAIQFAHAARCPRRSRCRWTKRNVHRHAPLVSLLRYGKKMRETLSDGASASEFHGGWHARTLV